MGSCMILCVCILIICATTWFFSFLSQIEKTQANCNSVPRSCLSLSQGKLLFSVSFLVFLLMLILLGKGFTVTRWVYFLPFLVLMHSTLRLPVYLCHFMICFPTLLKHRWLSLRKSVCWGWWCERTPDTSEGSDRHAALLWSHFFFSPAVYLYLLIFILDFYYLGWLIGSIISKYAPLE